MYSAFIAAREPFGNTTYDTALSRAQVLEAQIDSVGVIEAGMGASTTEICTFHNYMIHNDMNWTFDHDLQARQSLVYETLK